MAQQQAMQAESEKKKGKRKASSSGNATGSSKVPSINRARISLARKKKQPHVESVDEE